MARASFVLRILPSNYESYVDRHKNVDPELLAAFGEAGLKSYSIYYYEGLLFAHMEADNLEDVFTALSNHPASHKWGDFMSDILQKWEDGNDSKRIEEVFQFTS